MMNPIEKAKQIKMLVLDVDGVLTSGIVYYLNQTEKMRGFHLHDGLGIKLLQKHGIQVGVISAKKSDEIKKRLHDLGVEHIYLGHEEKLPAYEEIKNKLQLTDDDIAYMGDDLPDLPLLRRAALAITVPQAPEIVQQQVDLITHKKGGKGAVREVCEFILKAQNKYQEAIDFYLTQ